MLGARDAAAPGPHRRHRRPRPVAADRLLPGDPARSRTTSGRSCSDMAVALLVFVNWFILLFKARTPDGLHGFVAGYIRYLTHLEAYFLLAANPFPAFYLIGNEPVPGRPRDRPAAACRTAGRRSSGSSSRPGAPGQRARCSGAGRAAAATSRAGSPSPSPSWLWWVGLFRARVPRGMRDLLVYCLGYSAQVSAYVFLAHRPLSVREPERVRGRPGPGEATDDAVEVAARPQHPVSVAVTDDLRRSRLLVFFRLPLAIPHLVWLLLWTIVALVVAFLTWSVRARRPARRRGRSTASSRATCATRTTSCAFLFLVGNPFPGFVGKPGSYPIELELPPAERQNRLVTFFRLLLAVPALLIGGRPGRALSGRRRLPRLVRRALPRPDAGRDCATSAPTRSATGPGERVRVPRHGAAIRTRGPRPDPASP